MKRKIALIVATVLCVAAMVACFAACDFFKKDGESFVALDINPSVEMIVDGNGKVTKIYGTNEDGQVLLYGEQLVGKPVDEVVEKVTKLSIQLGYINENNTVVGYSVSSDNGTAKDDKLATKIDAAIVAADDGASVTLTTNTEGAYSLLRQYEAFKAAHPQIDGIADLTIADFRLALSASETGEVTLEAAVTMDKAALVEVLSTAQATAVNYATTAYNELKAQAELAYDMVAKTAVNMAYMQFYTTNVMSHLDTALYGGMYSMYSMSADLLNSAANVAQWAIKKAQEFNQLDETQVAEIMTVLELAEEDKALLQDENGNVTLASVYAYLDVRFKNTEAGAQLEQIKTELDAVLTEVEAICAQAAATPEFQAGIGAIKTTLSTIQSTVAGFLSGTTAGAQLTADLTALQTAFETWTEDGFQVDDVRALAAAMQNKADSTLALIEQDLTEEEIEQINTRKAEIEANFASAKTEMQNKIAQAEASAKERLQELKAERQQANAQPAA